MLEVAEIATVTDLVSISFIHVVNLALQLHPYGRWAYSLVHSLSETVSTAGYL